MLTGVKDLDLLILIQLDDQNLVNVCKTNTTINELCNDQNFWLQRIMKMFPYLDLYILKKYKQDRDWSQYYIDDLRTINKTNAIYKLYNGAKNGYLDMVIIAVNKGADVTSDNYYALRNASAYGHLEVVKYLVKNGPKLSDNYTDSVILAIENGHLNILKYLVEQGANLEGPNRDDIEEAIGEANDNGDVDIVNYLVSQGVPDPR